MNRSAKIAIGIGVVAIVGALTWGGAFQGRIINVNRAVRQAVNPGSAAVQNVRRAPVDAARVGAAIQQQAANAGQARIASYSAINQAVRAGVIAPSLETVAYGADQAASGTLVPGTNTLLAFRVSQIGQHDAAVKKVMFYMNYPSVLQFSNWRVFAGDRDITGLARITHDVGGPYEGNVRGYVDIVRVVFAQEVRVAPGAPVVLRLQTDVAGVVPGAQMTTRLILEQGSTRVNSNAPKMLMCGASESCIVTDPSARIDLDSYLSVSLPWNRYFPNAPHEERNLRLKVDDLGLNATPTANVLTGPLSFIDPTRADRYDAVVYFDDNFNGQYDRGTEIGLQVDAQNQAQQNGMDRLNGPLTGQIMYRDEDAAAHYEEIAYIDIDSDGHYNAGNDIRLVQAAQHDLVGVIGRDMLIEPYSATFIWSDISSPDHSEKSPDWMSVTEAMSRYSITKHLGVPGVLR